MQKYIRIIVSQPRPIRFLISRVLRHSGLWRFFNVVGEDYKLRLHPASHSLSLWVYPDISCDDCYVLRSLLRSGERFIDVGANVGLLTVLAARKVGPSGVVTAFEAHPRTVTFLRENIKRNNLHNVRTAQLAVGQENGWVTFTDINTDDQNKVSAEGNVTVPVISLDSLIGNESARVLKIDVEGFEYYVLKGAENFLNNVDFVYFEVWDKNFATYGYSFADMADFLASKNFKIAKLRGTHLTPISRDAVIPLCTNFLAYKDANLLRERTGWTIE